MPRRPREFVEGGIYHVFNRGNNRANLFECQEDFRCFLTLAGLAKQRHPVCIFHYCLMTNHFHFLVQRQTKEALPFFMHWLELGYARYFKKKYQTTGHIFEERFRSPRIAEDSYYLQCGRYIERNPVKAQIVSRAWEYPYSSASYYAEGIADPLIAPNFYYFEMGCHESERRDSYRQFLSLEDPYTPMIEAQLMKY